MLAQGETNCRDGRAEPNVSECALLALWDVQGRGHDSQNYIELENGLEVEMWT